VTSSAEDVMGRRVSACLILKLVLQAVSYRNAVFVSDPVAISQRIIGLLKLEILPEDILLVSSEIGAALLMSPLVNLPQEDVSSIIFKVRELSVETSNVITLYLTSCLVHVL
jgi:hypothetical protein